MLTSVLLAATLTPAHACGGFFCNSAQPVVQNAERIVFGIDHETGYVDTHVQIFYEGPADEFAWIVPVPDEPELFVSSQVMFDALAVRTGPIFSMNQIIEGRCKSDNGGLFGGGDREFALADASAPSAGGTSTISVVSEAKVGPYDTIVLKAENEDGLIDFLQDNGYDLPDEISEVLAPYISKDAHFVALKLQKDKDVGDIAPLGMRYRGDRAMVPIQLTSVAAAPDTRLEVYVFADERAVPKSYLHVQINDAAVDWWNFGTNYPDVITQAANEAGGHAFGTDFAGDPSFLQFSVYGGQYNVDPLRAYSDARTWISELKRMGFPESSELINVVMDNVAAPAGADPEDFFACPTCYGDWDAFDFDPDAATDDLYDRMVRPLEDAEDMFTRRYLTRMTSSLDAAEMTVDPVFVLNPDMSRAKYDVAQTHTTDMVYECGNGRAMDKAPRRMVLADGREIDLPSESWFAENNTTEFEFIEALGETKAQIIEQTGESGAPVVLFDYTDELFDLTDAHNDMVRGLLGLGCGCAVAAAGGNLAGTSIMLGLLALGARRRRR